MNGLLPVKSGKYIRSCEICFHLSNKVEFADYKGNYVETSYDISRDFQ